jgi:DNA-binding response OmpR family regulator
MTATGSQQLLIVDDEPSLLRLMQTYLERMGYAVVGCSRLEEALEVQRQGKRFSLAVLDLFLTDARGAEAVLQLAAQDAHLRILICSGYPFDCSTLPPEIAARTAFLQKPFLPKLLAAEVKALLDRASIAEC